MINKSIYFLHIPKTSGTTVTEYIGQIFSKDEIFTYQRWDLAFQEKSAQELTQILIEDKFKFYRGHFGFHHKFVKNKFVFTMLRNPENRTVSQYNHIIRFPNGNGWVNQGFLKAPDETLKSILSDPGRASIITNVQTRYLSSPYNPKTDKNVDANFLYDENKKFVTFTISNPKLSLIISIWRLLRLNFFGLQEYHEESMLMLANILKIKVPLLTDRKQYFGNESFSDQTDTETQNLLFHTNNLDNKLYYFARYIFEKRLITFINKQLNTRLNIYEYLSNRQKYLIELESIMLK